MHVKFSSNLFTPEESHSHTRATEFTSQSKAIWCQFLDFLPPKRSHLYFPAGSLCEWQLTFSTGCPNVLRSELCNVWKCLYQLGDRGYVSCPEMTPDVSLLQDTDHILLFPVCAADLKPARPRRQWCFNVIVVYLILQTALNAFLIYKGTSAHSFLF